MIEDYIEYWGLKHHPFLLAPDSAMMHTSGQYYECLERLKYAINTNKGGALLVSEDAGLGKTTLLLKLIDEMRAQHGSAFKYAFVNHPTLTPNQLIAFIAGCFADATPNDDGRPSNLSLDFTQSRRQVMPELGADDDKLKNLMRLKESLLEVKRQGGKNIIIVDEGQMLCGAREVLQELRVLINLTYNNEYLHTFILSGQKPLWNEVKSIPELWQRLPVRYYLVSLRLEETRELIKYRLGKAGLDDEKEIFTSDAFEIIQRYSMGSPRTIIALADLALLMGYADRSNRISFKELTKAINAMAGKGESLAYVKEEKQKREPTPAPIPELRAHPTSLREEAPTKERLVDNTVVPDRVQTPVTPQGREETVQEQTYSHSPGELPLNPASFKEEKPAEDILIEDQDTPYAKRETVQERTYSPPPPPLPTSTPVDGLEATPVSTKEGRPAEESLVDNHVLPGRGQGPVASDREQGTVQELEVNPINRETMGAASPDSGANKGPGMMERPIRPRLAVLAISLAIAIFVAVGYYTASDEVNALKKAPLKKEAPFGVADRSEQQGQETPEEHSQKTGPTKQTAAERQRDRMNSQKEEDRKTEKEEVAGKVSPIGQQVASNRNVTKPEKEVLVRKVEPPKQAETLRQKDVPKPEKETQIQKAVLNKQEKAERRDGITEKTEKEVVVISMTGANIRSGPDIRSQRIGLFMEGEQFKVIDEQKDGDGQTWYKLHMHGSREGWVSEKTVILK